jgi:hypothetical protein
VTCSCGSPAPYAFHASCRRRARWTVAERDAWDREDDAAFAREAALRSSLVDAPALQAGVALLTDRRREDLAGKRFGALVVLRPIIRFLKAGWSRRDWIVECDCGVTFAIEASKLRRIARSCKACSYARAGEARAHKVGRLRVPELALRAGVSESAIRQRIRLGWSPRQIASPPARRAA